MRVTIGQINTTNGDFEGNTERILRAIEQAKKENSDLVVFPEVSVQGYTSFDWFLDRDIVESSLKPLEKIIPATAGLTAAACWRGPTRASPYRRRSMRLSGRHTGWRTRCPRLTLSRSV